MKYLLAAALAALACAPAMAPAMAQSRGGSMMISMMDLDENGRVSVDEWVEMSIPMIGFMVGLKMTQAEYQDTLTGTTEETAQTAREKFAKFDFDRDSFLSLEEYKATFAADFSAMDTDGNGDLTAQEYDGAQPKQGHAH
jgi:hypothetical protein